MATCSRNANSLTLWLQKTVSLLTSSNVLNNPQWKSNNRRHLRLKFNPPQQIMRAQTLRNRHLNKRWKLHVLCPNNVNLQFKSIFPITKKQNNQNIFLINSTITCRPRLGYLMA